MSELHDALQLLAPTDISDFPEEGPELEEHISTALASSRTLITSVPPPAVVPSSATLPPAPAASLSAEWKPVKISAKDNPLGISVFKLSSKDSRGTWFARRSIHADIPFARFQACLQREFEQSNGSEGAVRGIGKEKRVEHRKSSMGSAAVYQLSARFPAIAPREFVQGVVSTTAHPDGADSDGGEDRPRQFTFISRPVRNHPECEERQGFVRGQYESIEFIRELPGPAERDSLKRAQSSPSVPQLLDGEPSSPGRKRGKTVTGSDGDGQQLPHCPAVDWIMITRSDPGGNVPRWMVERGTPNGIIKDAEKFLDWARTQTFEADDLGHEHDTGVPTHEQLRAETQKHLVDENRLPADAAVSTDTAAAVLNPQASEAQRELARQTEPADDTPTSGLIASAFSTLSGGLTSLASSTLGSSNPTPPHTPSSASPEHADDASSTTSSREHSRPATPSLYEDARDAYDNDDDDDAASITSFHSAATADSARSATSTTGTGGTSTSASKKTPEDRALERYRREKQKLEGRRAKEFEKNQHKAQKATEKHLRELEKQERKYRRALEKAQERKRKEEAKRMREMERVRERLEKTAGDREDLEGQAKSEAEKKFANSSLNLGVGAHVEIDELKRIIEGLTRENLELRKRVDELEAREKKALDAAEGKITAQDVSGAGGSPASDVMN